MGLKFDKDLAFQDEVAHFVETDSGFSHFVDTTEFAQIGAEKALSGLAEISQVDGDKTQGSYRKKVPAQLRLLVASLLRNNN